MDKVAVDAQKLLRWVLGAAALGAGTRAAFGVGRQIFGKTNPMKAEEDIYDPSIEVPVYVTPEQQAGYEKARKQYGLKSDGDDIEKQASSPWDPTMYTLAGVGGGALGWGLTSALLKKIRDMRLNSELKARRDELTQIMYDPEDAEPDVKTAAVRAVADLVDIAARRHQHAHDASTKVASVKVASRWLIPSLLAGGAGALALGSMAPGTRDVINQAGNTVADVAGGAAKTMSRPLTDTALAVLGPVAALSLLYGLHKGWGAERKSDPELAKLEAFRRGVRESEGQQTPYFKLVPKTRVGVEAKTKDKKKSATGLNTVYGDLEKAANLKALGADVMKLAGMAMPMSSVANTPKQTSQMQKPKPAVQLPKMKPSPQPTVQPKAFAAATGAEPVKTQPIVGGAAASGV